MHFLGLTDSNASYKVSKKNEKHYLRYNYK